jgi:hypothetical protein
MKEIKAVKLMRDIRDKISDKYLKEEGLQEKELQEIRKKYGIKKQKIGTHTQSK